ncbi:bifunctional hydroxymethylpyrimidine kinase/phosphomethylpyrimidine kinase [Mumia zhuanghuii]|uniref:Bifunctional hydroxymethylpyrimidine kinase/phosphomethylpyrimidine kinase n=2 Tax=Mumia TaxID=1546255 RepID=A0ABW1QR04_9ACTN|nr:MULTISPECIES: bifunctional hydroxymethylpyrimidine kinase/phosphomethylpyrimidine kinase [Mumia]KAA1420409.1 bifunctional hydroxymethylpyrimidine kinase/phosphomethylpyrimidine kinase [Mumia zhuanghuii]
MTDVPVMLSIAGSDPSGGAGIQADLKTATALGAYGAAVITALTVQNTLGVTGIHAVPPDFVAAQIRSVLDDLDVGAVKIGMLGTADAVVEVAVALGSADVPIVLDPVMVATSGDRLVPPDAVDAIRTMLLPLATVVTPNVPEAAVLVGADPAKDVDGLAEAAYALRGIGASAALVKGGHLGGDLSVDVLADADGVRTYEAPRVATANTHGTGCTLSSAIAAGLALGLPLRDAVADAKDYLTGALRGGADQHLGHGSGPVDHLWRQRS